MVDRGCFLGVNGTYANWLQRIRLRKSRSPGRDDTRWFVGDEFRVRRRDSRTRRGKALWCIGLYNGMRELRLHESGRFDIQFTSCPTRWDGMENLVGWHNSHSIHPINPFDLSFKTIHASQSSYKSQKHPRKTAPSHPRTFLPRPMHSTYTKLTLPSPSHDATHATTKTASTTRFESTSQPPHPTTTFHPTIHPCTTTSPPKNPSKLARPNRYPNTLRSPSHSTMRCRFHARKMKKSRLSAVAGMLEREEEEEVM